MRIRIIKSLLPSPPEADQREEKNPSLVKRGKERFFNNDSLFMNSMVFFRITFILVFLITGASHLNAAETVEVIVHGLEGEVLENVESALSVPEGMVREGRVNELWLDYFRDSAEEKIRRAMEPYGYYTPRVNVIPEKADGRYRVIAKVEPGKPVRVTEVKVSISGPGAGEKTLVALISGFPLRKGDILFHTKYEEGKGLLKVGAQELGYLDADFSVNSILVSREQLSAGIELILETGPRYRFGEIRFEGAPEYSEKFLRRHVTFRKGDVFSQSKLGETQLHFLNSGRFNSTMMTPEKDKEEDFLVPVLITLKTAPPKRFRAGIGYSTDTGGRLSANYTDLNVYGDRGHEFSGILTLSERLQGLGVGYIIPGSKDIDNLTAFRLNFQNEELDTYDNKLLSFEASRTRSFRKGRLGTVYAKVQHEESTIAPESISSFFVMPGVRFSQLIYDDLVRPTKGFSYAIEARGMSKYLISDMNLLQVLAQGNLLFPLPGRLSVFTRVQTAMSFQDEPLRELPASLRFFAGGDRSVRGYKYQSLGPEDKSGEVTGGKHLIAGSIEIERALSDDWGIAVFYDAGNAFNSLWDIKLYQGAGLGLRYNTVIGALRLDVARQIGVDDPKFRIHFSAGFQL
jgi:translocation and assembly module TamA